MYRVVVLDLVPVMWLGVFDNVVENLDTVVSKLIPRVPVLLDLDLASTS